MKPIKIKNKWKCSYKRKEEIRGLIKPAYNEELEKLVKKFEQNICQAVGCTPEMLGFENIVEEINTIDKRKGKRYFKRVRKGLSW